MRRSIPRRTLLLITALLVPACGGGGSSGGGSAGPGAPPSAALVTPVGSQRSVVPIDFVLADAESNAVTITVEFSADGGASYSAATPAFGNGPLAGLASSPGGIAHTFLWDSVDDGIATGTMGPGLTILNVGTVNAQVRFRITPSDGGAGTPGTTSNFTVDNTFERTTGIASNILPHTFAAMGNSETALGDLVADAIRLRYGTQLALQNGWGIRTPLPSSMLPANMTLRRPSGGYAAGPPYDLVVGDVYLMLPFGNRVITRTVTGSQVWAMLELGVGSYPGNFNGFPQISGFSFTFNSTLPAGSRVVSVTLAGGGAIANDATTYTFATNDFLNAGGDSYSMLNDGQGTVREIMAQVVADHIRLTGPITPTVAGRITVVP